MSKRVMCAIVVAGSILAGCAAMYPRVERKSARLDCDGSRACTVTVDVSCERWYGCTLSVDYDLILVDARGRPTDITWKLAGEPGAEFAANGIGLDSAEFDCQPKAERSKKEFGCSDQHRDFGVFKYSINVTLPSTAFGPRGAPSLDPWIVNK